MSVSRLNKNCLAEVLQKVPSLYDANVESERELKIGRLRYAISLVERDWIEDKQAFTS
jgi:hypothetical protein